DRRSAGDVDAVAGPEDRAEVDAADLELLADLRGADRPRLPLLRCTADIEVGQARAGRGVGSVGIDEVDDADPAAADGRLLLQRDRLRAEQDQDREGRAHGFLRRVLTPWRTSSATWMTLLLSSNARCAWTRSMSSRVRSMFDCSNCPCRRTPSPSPGRP